jgi:adenylate cyclase
VAIEIERKFLVEGDAWRRDVEKRAELRQGYLAVNDCCAVRVRLDDERARLNIKRATLDLRRHEYEYEIPLAEAREMLDLLCDGRQLVKTRHYLHHTGHLWEVDEFHGANAGLVVAEIELAAEDEVFARPPWLGKEVSGDPRYLNSSLAQRPYSGWADR